MWGIVFLLTTIGLIIWVYWLINNQRNWKKEYDNAFLKYEHLLDIDLEIENKQRELMQYESDISIIKADTETLDNHLEDLINIKKELDKDLLSLECGLYTPHFDFATSERYKISMLANRQTQKNMISSWKAIKTSFDLKSRKKDIRLDAVKRIAKLMLKAFNGEADSIISEVRWNNVLKMVERLHKVFTDINEMAFEDVSISEDYLKLKTEDLYLTYEFAKKKQEEKEEQLRIREQMREERKIQEEIERKQKELEEQEKKALELAKLIEQAKIEGKNEASQEYEKQLDDMQKIIDDSKRAISNAQLTKRGTVYIISNIGSFGENIYKIGMTRREDPQERVDELGDASVPFRFDVHAFIVSDNAPDLENKLHEKFKLKSVNRVNYRKEFFNVNLEEIEQAVKEINPQLEFEITKIAEASEFYQTQAIIDSENQFV